MSENSEHLRKALEWFENGEKWDQGSLWDNGGGCLVGALILAKYGVQDDSKDTALCLPCTTTLAAVIWDLYPDRVANLANKDNYIGTVEGFNDHDSTTFEDITLVMKHAIEIEEVQHQLWEGNHLA